MLVLPSLALSGFSLLVSRAELEVTSSIEEGFWVSGSFSVEG